MHYSLVVVVVPLLSKQLMNYKQMNQLHLHRSPPTVDEVDIGPAKSSV